MIRFWLIVIAVLGLDQATKLAVERLLTPGASVEVSGTLVRLTFVLNPGGAFGIMGDRQVLLLVIGILAVVLLLAALPWIVRSGLVWPAGLLFGGALGNLADRLRHGKVVDFIDLGFWPVFNAADVAIVAGAALMILVVFRGKRGRRGELDDPA